MVLIMPTKTFNTATKVRLFSFNFIDTFRSFILEYCQDLSAKYKFHPKNFLIQVSKTDRYGAVNESLLAHGLEGAHSGQSAGLAPLLEEFRGVWNIREDIGIGFNVDLSANTQKLLESLIYYILLKVSLNY